MADPTRSPDPRPQRDDVVAGSRTAAGMPRWVKTSLIVILALAALFVAAKVAGLGGEHGPGRHGMGADAPSSVLNATTGTS